MRLSRTAAYALHALVYLAAHAGGRHLSAPAIAEATGIPGPYLPKILRLLASAGLLRPVRGPGGGYTLARPLAKVTLLEVVEAVDGPLRGEAPLARERGATDLDRRLQVVCDEAAALVRKRLAGVRLADLGGG